jgi:hypothetical protein
VTRYVVLTNRKRAIVALVHTVVFLGVSFVGFVTVVRPLETSSPVSAWILATVYLVVSAVLWTLTAISRRAVERLYFALCATSAAFGLWRQIAGDPRMHLAVYVRVMLLAGAVAVGSWILRGHGAAPPPREQADAGMAAEEAGE